MSVVSHLPIRKDQQRHVEPNSLLENLYIYYPLSKLEKMLKEKPQDSMLLMWNVKPREFHAIVQRAINLVQDD